MCLGLVSDVVAVDDGAAADLELADADLDFALTLYVAASAASFFL